MMADGGEVDDRVGGRELVGEGPGASAGWAHLTDAEREREYSPSSCLPDGDYRPFIDQYQTASLAAWSQLEVLPGARTSVVAYGQSAAQTIDVALPALSGPAPPLLVFIHGGYWQELSKRESRFGASDCVARGWAFAAVDYTLAPAADVATIVDECRQGLRALQAEASTLGFDPGRVFVAGSSAGAHLAAMVALDPDRAGPPVRGTVLVSGIYELAPLVGTSINDALGLDVAAAERVSPLRAPLTGFPPALVAYGENETGEFKAQSHDFARALDTVGTPVSLLEVPGRNHFDVVLDLAKPRTLLGEAVARLIEPTGGPDAIV